MHDLRHTFATRLQGLGVGYEVRQALLGHRMPGETHNYSHGSQAWDEQMCEAVRLLDVDYRSHDIVSAIVSRHSHHLKVVGMHGYKSLKDQQKLGEMSGMPMPGERYPTAIPWQLLNFSR